MPRPVLQALVLADHVYQDGLSHKFIIAGTFGRMWFRRQPKASADEQKREESRTRQADTIEEVLAHVSQAGSPWLYFALTDVHGRLPLQVKYVDLSDSSTLFEMSFEVASSDPIGVAEFALPMPALPRAKIGTYSVDLLHDSEILGSWRVVVSESSEKNQPGAST